MTLDKGKLSLELAFDLGEGMGARRGELGINLSGWHLTHARSGEGQTGPTDKRISGLI